MMTDKSGQCMCGAVRFTARNVRTGFGACHCKMCQRWAGSALLAVTVPADDITWTGLDKVQTIQSSDWAERGWCTTCGSGLWYRITAESKHKGNYEIPIGIFDDADGFTLEQEIFVDRKSNSFELAGDHRQLTEAEVFAIYRQGVDGA